MARITNEKDVGQDSNSNYYQEAHDWRYQIYESQQVWLNRSLLATAVLGLLLILSLVSHLLLLPLKEKIPFLYVLNETTGELTQLGNFTQDSFKADWLMTRFFLIRYVENRESYDNDNLDHPYQITWAMSDESMATQYAKSVQTNNSDSPYAKYGKDKFISVHILSVNQLNENSAEVRFEQTLHDRSLDHQETIQKAAIIKWKYTQPTTTIKMLDRDPLGFKVIYYQISQLSIDNH